MKIKTFFAPNVPKAMEEIRETYTDNAVIISAVKTENGVKLIVAIEDKIPEADLFSSLNDEKIKNRTHYFLNLLKHHAFEDVFIQRLAQASLKKGIKTPEEKLLTNAFSELYRFKPIYPIESNTIYVLIGNSGSGKTLLTKKMALQAKKQRLKPCIVTLDTIKSGAVNDLKHFAKFLKIPFSVVNNIKDLNETITMARLSADYILVDTPAINPYKITDLDKLKFMRNQLVDAEFILTMPAGLDAQEAVSEGALFYKNGCTSFIATKIDCAVRYYNLFKTTLYNSFNWAAFSYSDSIICSPTEASAQNLSTLLTNPLTLKNETEL